MHTFRKIFFYCLLFVLCGLNARSTFSQNSTRLSNDKVKTLPGSSSEKTEERKVLVIPFEPKLYMSEIDQHVNKETKLNFKQIRGAFRSGLDYAVTTEFKKKYKVVSLLNDSSRSTMDQTYVYQSIGYKYEILPDPEKKDEKPVTENTPIQNGQLMVSTNDRKKYMNTKIINPNLLQTLHKKYKTDIFVFINQLDLKNNVDTKTLVASETYERIASVHYSIFDLNGKLLDSGLAAKSFPSTANNPNKIVNSYFTDIAETILQNFVTAITPQPEKGKNTLEWQHGK